MNLQQAIDQRRQNTTNQFYTGLMQHAMSDTPQYDMTGDKPVYIGSSGPKLKSKTELWNQFVQIKGGRLSPQDLAEFEQYYQSTIGAQQANQLKGLQELKMRGYSDKKIRKMIKDTPDLYNNLMDIVTKFEASGDEQGAMAGATVRAFLPTDEKGLLHDEMGIGTQLGMLGAGAAGVGAYKYATGIDHAAVTQARKDYVQEGKSWKDSKSAMEDNLKKQQKAIASKKLEITSEKSKHLLKRNDLKIRNLNAELNRLESGYAKMVSEADVLGKKGPTYNPAKSRLQNFKEAYPKASSGLKGTSSLLGMILAAPVGKAVGGETGERVATGGVGAAIAGSGIKRFAAGMLARRAAAGAANFNPYTQAALLAADVGIGGSMLYSALQGE